MTSRKPHERSASRHNARVDDVLVHSRLLRQDIHAIVTALRPETLSEDEAREVAHTIRQKGPQALLALLDCLFEEDKAHQRIALMLLSEIQDPAIAHKIRELLQRPHISEKVRNSLLTLEALYNHGAGEEGGESSAPLTLESLLDVAEDFWETMELEEIATMWSDHFIEEPAEHRLPVLEALLATNQPKLLGLARLELAIGHPKIAQFLVEKLGQFDDPYAIHLLEPMLGFPDLMVRTLAEKSIRDIRIRIEKHPANELLPCILAKPRFYRAHMATDDWGGHYTLVYAVKSLDGAIKFFVTLIDRADRGIMDVWGCCRYSEQQFKELLSTMARDFADLQQHRVSKQTALTLLNRAVALSLERNHPLPVGFSAWVHLVEFDKFREDDAVPPFGLTCTLCEKPIRTGPRLAPPLVFGHVVVCHRCSHRALKCSTCGGTTTLPKCLVTNEDGGETSDLRCPHCFESFHAAGS